MSKTGILLFVCSGCHEENICRSSGRACMDSLLFFPVFLWYHKKKKIADIWDCYPTLTHISLIVQSHSSAIIIDSAWHNTFTNVDVLLLQVTQGISEFFYTKMVSCMNEIGKVQ